MKPLVNGISVDVEEAFHANAFDGLIDPADWDGMEQRVHRNVARLLDTFAHADVRATFFILGWVAERWPGLVRRIHDAGHEVASHGYGHRRIHGLTRTEFEQDVRRSKAVLENIIGCAVDGYRAPTYSITKGTLWALDVLADTGFRYDSSIFPVHHDRYGVPTAPRFPYRIRTTCGATVLELPPSTVRMAGLNLPVAGGGYLRLYPLRVTTAAIRRINDKEGQPAFVYLHPWEVDPHQPRLPGGPVRWWRHSVNQHRILDRLERLLTLFPFGPLRDHLDQTTPPPCLPVEALARAGPTFRSSAQPHDSAHTHTRHDSRKRS